MARGLSPFSSLSLSLFRALPIPTVARRILNRGESTKREGAEKDEGEGNSVCGCERTDHYAAEGAVCRQRRARRRVSRAPAVVPQRRRRAAHSPDSFGGDVIPVLIYPLKYKEMSDEYLVVSIVDIHTVQYCRSGSISRSGEHTGYLAR